MTVNEDVDALTDIPLVDPNTWQPTMNKHRSRIKHTVDKLARLMLCFASGAEAAACGLPVTLWFWSVANTLSSERERLVARIVDPRNQTLDVQYILGQNVLTEDLVRQLQAINIKEPTASGNYASCYLGHVVRSKESQNGGPKTTWVYIGSAIGANGEIGRLTAHERILGLGQDGVSKDQRITVALLGKLAPTGGVRRNRGETIWVDASQNLLEEFSDTGQEWAIEHPFYVANRCHPLAQSLPYPTVHIGNSDDLPIFAKLREFRLETHKRSLSRQDVERIIIKLGDSVLEHTDTFMFVRKGYATLLTEEGSTYQSLGGTSQDYRHSVVAAASVIKVASSSRLQETKAQLRDDSTEYSAEDIALESEVLHSFIYLVAKEHSKLIRLGEPVEDPPQERQLSGDAHDTVMSRDISPDVLTTIKDLQSGGGTFSPIDDMASDHEVSKSISPGSSSGPSAQASVRARYTWRRELKPMKISMDLVTHTVKGHVLKNGLDSRRYLEGSQKPVLEPVKPTSRTRQIPRKNDQNVTTEHPTPKSKKRSQLPTETEEISVLELVRPCSSTRQTTTEDDQNATTEVPTPKSKKRSQIPTEIEKPPMLRPSKPSSMKWQRPTENDGRETVDEYFSRIVSLDTIPSRKASHDSDLTQIRKVVREGGYIGGLLSYFLDQSAVKIYASGVLKKISWRYALKVPKSQRFQSQAAVMELFGILRAQVCSMTGQLTTDNVVLDALYRGTRILKSVRIELRNGFSESVRQLSGFSDSSFNYGDNGEYPFMNLTEKAKDGTCLFDQLEAVHQKQKREDIAVSDEKIRNQGEIDEDEDSALTDLEDLDEIESEDGADHQPIGTKRKLEEDVAEKEDESGNTMNTEHVDHPKSTRKLQRLGNGAH
ncbi:MAG: hypothetical protein Q9226_004290 [Calogaya cf. arnoldii]